MKKNTRKYWYILYKAIFSCALLFFTFLCSAEFLFANSEQESLVTYYLAEGIIPPEREQYADAVVFGVEDEVSSSVLTELFISYEIIPSEQVEVARAYVGSDTPPKPELVIEVAGNTTPASTIEVQISEPTDGVVTTIGTLTAEGGDIEVFELPVRVSVETAEIENVVSSVAFILDGVLYSSEVISYDGTSELATFYFGAQNEKPRFEILEGESVEFQVVVSFLGTESGYESGETVETYLSESEVGSIVSKQRIKNATPSVLAELLLAHDIVAPEQAGTVRDLSLSFNNQEGPEFIEKCNTEGLILEGLMEDARVLLYENSSVILSGTALGEMHTLMLSGVYAEIMGLDAITDSYGVDDDVLGIFTFQFDLTAYMHPYFISATTTSVFDVTIEDENGNPVSFSIASSSLSAQTSSFVGGEVYYLEANTTESFILTQVIYPQVEGEYRAHLKSISYGDDENDAYNMGKYYTAPEADYATSPVFLMEGSEPRDTESPTITLLGDNPVEVALGGEYVEAGAMANDETDGDITSLIDILGEVDVDVVGTYVITYAVMDEANNEASTTRTVFVYSPLSGGGGGFNDSNPPRKIRILLENGNEVINERLVTVQLSALDSSKPVYVQLSEDPIFNNNTWIVMQKNTTFLLSEGFGSKTVYARFKDAHGNISHTVFDTIAFEKNATKNKQGQVRGITQYHFMNDMGMGMENVDVRELQKRLKEEGFFTHPFITGYFGVVTREAVKKYQEHNKISVTGFVGPVTRSVLNAVVLQSGDVSREELESFIHLCISLGLLSEDKAERIRLLLATF